MVKREIQPYLTACQFDQIINLGMTDPYSSLSSLSPAITIDNICGKFRMNASLDLNYLASKIWNSAYNPRRLPALIIRKTKPRATVLVYGTGSAMVIGAESMQRLQEVSMKVAREIAAVLNIKKLKAESITVTNIVGKGQLDFKIDMNRLCENRRALKPDNMTAVIYRLEEPIKKVMVYRSGKMLLWGAKTLEDVEMAYQMMRKQMLPYELSIKSDPYYTSDPQTQEIT